MHMHPNAKAYTLALIVGARPPKIPQISQVLTLYMSCKALEKLGRCDDKIKFKNLLTLITHSFSQVSI